jgi:hypothetical protein
MPDPIEALSVLKHLLKPRGGIIRGNLTQLISALPLLPRTGSLPNDGIDG